MKKNNRKIVLFGLLFPLTACSFGSSPFSWSSYLNDDFAMDLQSSKFKNFKLEDFNDLDFKKTRLENEVNNKGTASKFVSYYNTLMSDYSKLFNSYIIASTKYYATGEDSYRQKTENYLNKFSALRIFILGLEPNIVNSSDEIKKAYFGEKSDEDIQKEISGNEKAMIMEEYEAIFNSYQNDGEELYNKYLNDRNASAYLDTGYDYFLRYIEKGNEMISKVDYKNFLDYSYDRTYGRDYKIEDALAFVQNVKKYLVPIYKAKKVLTQPADYNDSLANAFNNKNFCNQGTDNAEMFTSYAKEMGGRYLAAYNNAFKYGYYCFSDSPNSLGAAYEWSMSANNDAVLYFSRNYQNIFSVVHEFGHYYACTTNNGARANDSYDLQETYSQGDEFTFATYLLEQKKDSTDYSTYEFILDDKEYQQLKYIIDEAAITEIENFAFTTPNLTKETLRSGVESIIDSYEGTARTTYFMAPVLTAPCYYISYATSLIESLQFAHMDFASAKNSYKKMIEDEGEMTMVQRWTNAGLKSPFEEDTIQEMAKTLSDISNKY